MAENLDQKKIAFFIGSMRRGGAERVISILANNYASRGWKVDILTLLDDSNNYVLDKRIQFLPICSKGKSQTKRIPYWLKTVRHYVKTERPDRMVSFITRINLITLFSCIGLGKHIVVSERSDPAAPGKMPFYIMFLIRLLYPMADHVVFQTEWAKSYFSKKIQKKGIILSNPIDVNVEALENKKKKIVAVGRLMPEKNHAMLISAFERVHKKYEGYKLYIYGEGQLKEELEKQVQLLNISDAVFLPGNVLNVHERIADAEIFVLSSNYEGFSNALLEAMMIGLPCISTDVAGSNEIVQTEKNGILIKKRNEQQLFEALCHLIDNKAAALEMGMQAKQSVQFTRSENLLGHWQKCIEQDEKG